MCVCAGSTGGGGAHGGRAHKGAIAREVEEGRRRRRRGAGAATATAASRCADGRRRLGTRRGGHDVEVRRRGRTAASRCGGARTDERRRRRGARVGARGGDLLWFGASREWISVWKKLQVPAYVRRPLVPVGGSNRN